jgi:hypothetical protein
MRKPTITPLDHYNSTYRTGKIDPISVEEITETLGFGPNVSDDPAKVTASWLFEVDGHVCAIWDYYGIRWSVYDPDKVLRYVFPGKVD